MTNTPEYKAWDGARQRCNNQFNKDYVNYGGRGIKVCERWQDSFVNFFRDMGPRPSSFHSLGRKNNDGDYSPENCRWETVKQQSYNRRFENNHNAVKTHCRKGHEYTNENTYYYPDGRRDCRECKKLYGAKYRNKDA